jgi:hypothetical protein
MQRNPNESYTDEDGAVYLPITMVYGTEPEPEPEKTATSWTPPFAGIYTGSTFNPDLLRVPTHTMQPVEPAVPVPTPQEKLASAAEEEIRLQRERLETEKEQIPARLDEQIKKLIEQNPHVNNASEIQQATSEIEVIDRMLAGLIPLKDYFSKNSNYLGSSASTLTGQAFVENIEAAGGIKDGHFNALQLIDLKAALGAEAIAERMENQIKILQQRRSEVEARLQALITPAPSTDPALLELQLTNLLQQASSVIEDQPRFVAERIRSYLAADSQKTPAETIEAISQALEKTFNDYYTPEDGIITFYKLSKVTLSKPELDELYEKIKTGGSYLYNPQQNLNDEAARYLAEARTQVEALKRVAQTTADQLKKIREVEAAFQAEASRIKAELEARRQQQLDEANLIAQQQEEAVARKAAADARQAAQAAEVERLKAFLDQPGAMKVGIPSVTAPAFISSAAAFTLSELGATHLATAIAEALARLATAAIAGAASLLPGLAVGFVALLVPAPLAPSERRNALGLPLANAPVIDSQTLSMAKHDDVVSLSHALNLRTTEAGVQVSVIQRSAGLSLTARVVNVVLQPTQGRYEAVVGYPPRLITATPASPPGLQPSSTELPATSQPVPAIEGSPFKLFDPTLQGTPALEVVETESYILRFPVESGILPIYLAIQKPPVEALEVGEYAELSRRSIKDGLDIDHIPSRKALEYALLRKHKDITSSELRYISDHGIGIAIPQHIHRSFSETSGARNTKEKQSLDGSDLRQAVENNFFALRAALIAEGYNTELLNNALKDLHEKNIAKGFYE